MLLRLGTYYNNSNTAQPITISIPIADFPAAAVYASADNGADCPVLAGGATQYFDMSNNILSQRAIQSIALSEDGTNLIICYSQTDTPYQGTPGITTFKTKKVALTDVA